MGDTGCKWRHFSRRMGQRQCRARNTQQNRPINRAILIEAGNEIRTRDILLGKQTLYQLSYTRASQQLL